MDRPDAERIRRLLGAPELAPFVGRLRGRLARGQPLGGQITLHGLEPVQRDAVAALVGRTLTPGNSSTRVSLGLLEERLRAAGICGSLREAVEILGGPVVDRRSARATTLAAWAGVFADARSDPVYAGPLAEWLGRLEEAGLLKRLSSGSPSTGAELLTAVAGIAAALPADGLPLATLAARTFGDAHALDPGTSAATLAVRAAAVLGGVRYRDTAEGRRSAWAGVGVLCDELSTPALVLNLPAEGDTPLARLLHEASTAGEPLHVSLRLLLRHPLTADPALRSRDVYVCENATIVALAAARLGARCAPVVCVNGQPATPSHVLLRQLATAGARLRYHGDFDWGGLQVARYVIERFGARPWRMETADYLSAAHLGRPLGRAPSASPWDPTLASAIARERRAVHEELVAETLLEDLGTRSWESPPRF